ncbi:hypothetical protein GUJ93_ZPchr0011g28484 [Zizania palustris]|uniref:Uncharacterized protein n=1 Tax=Zizania palustris TaxID=103762 RepID=A0A8J5WIK3_ZIZPA|nr:hypothetical protein GUJ93_ZPchr0011g28484 [Zizania palustris]
MATTAAHSLLHLPAPKLAAPVRLTPSAMATIVARSLPHLPVLKPTTPAHLAPTTIEASRSLDATFRIAARSSSGNGGLTAFPNLDDILITVSTLPSSSSHIDVDQHVPSLPRSPASYGMLLLGPYPLVLTFFHW